MGLVNKVMELLMSKRISILDECSAKPLETQEAVLFYLLGKAYQTQYGKKFQFDDITDYEKFKENVPLVHYEDFEGYIEQARQGEKNVTWPGKIKWFAKSSGTTNAKSKFIPISEESLEDCHYSAGKTMFALYLKNNPETEIFKNKNLRIGGSSQLYQEYETLFGDLSAILIDNLPFYAEFRNTPNKEISLMTEWESKMKAIADAVIPEEIGSLTGVPSWMMVVLQHVLEKTGKKYLDDIWPELEVFFHGGISFAPYADAYQKLTKKPLKFYEIYNASEGFFAIQDQNDSKEMLLLLDNGIFYEFIPMDEFHKENPTTISLKDVIVGKNYALVITTNGGLWRYILGDTVRFTNVAPHRIVVTGRTKHFINAFGEELIIDNAEAALKKACEATEAIIKDYTAGPIFMTGQEKGRHEWMIEFEKSPENREKFEEVLDLALQALNSDYEAKRYKNITLNPPKIHYTRANLFYDWMKERGKLGGQNKVPRLANNREYLDQLLELNNY